tara:strand:- start:619 stop:1101 length:483 start_codon:yes stop_codon:yes gene_type:complete
MGSDIYTDSAVALQLEDFLNVDAIKKKGVRELIANVLYQDKIIGDKAFADMIKNKGLFIETFVNTISLSEGYEGDEEHNQFMLQTFCEHVGIDLEELPDFYFRSFDSCRESGYDIKTNVVYIMFECFTLFETVMTDEGKKVAKNLGLDSIHETTWTVHSY